MLQKNLFLIFGLACIFLCGSVLNAGERVRPIPIPDNQFLIEKLSDDPKEPCDWLAYHVNMAYYFKTPDPQFQTPAYSMQFSVDLPETLQYVNIMFYDDGSGLCGNDTIFCTIYDDNGAGYPCDLLAETAVLPGGYGFAPNWTTFDFSSYNLVLFEDFDIAFSSSALPGSGDYECIMADDGSGPENRATFVIEPCIWLEEYGMDHNLLMEAYLCELTQEYIDTTWVESFFDVVMGSEPPMPGQQPDDVLEMNGEMILGWTDWVLNPAEQKYEFYTEVLDMNLTGSGPVLGEISIYTAGHLPRSMGLVQAEGFLPDFPADGYQEQFFTVEFENGRLASISRNRPSTLEPAGASEPPLDMFPPHFIMYADSIYRPLYLEEKQDSIHAWIRGQMTYYPMPYDTCYVTGDVNGDGIPLSVADMVYLTQFVSMDGPPPYPLYQGDMNGDCMIDQLDVEVYQCYFVNGMSCFPQYPIPSCCFPDTVRGACCDYLSENCMVLNPLNCQNVDGTYLGDGEPCNENICQFNCDCWPGDPSNNGMLNILGITYIIAYLYKGGSPPFPYEICNGDMNCDCKVNLQDITSIISYLYYGGNSSCSCEDWLNQCGWPLRK